jgi:multisubunit Na+/H+ antiporter MnhB subunit
MNCPNCGVELQENSRFCNACGTNLSINTTELTPTSDSSKSVSIGAIIATIIGAIGTLFSIMTIQSDINQWRYTYTSPFTEHETWMINIVFISIIVLISGIVAIYKSKR